MKKPKIFISSTIYDFKDLRSSLKYWLEEMGYNVQLSEFNDFEKDLDKNSYRACLESIEDCDYFILLMGGRVGGFYDSEEKISITQKEYRYAYQLAKEKKIKLINFVRKEIWDIKNDREALKNYLKQKYIKENELNKKDMEKIVSHDSDFMNDAKFIFDFLDEVKRKEEMIEATKSDKEFPPQNWVHQFNIFKDIIEVLETELSIDRDLQYNIHIKNIKREIGSNLTQLIHKSEDSIIYLYEWANAARKELSESYTGNSLINGRSLKRLTIFEVIGVGIANTFSTTFMESALSSGVFFRYSKEDNALKPSKLQEALIKLVEKIEYLKQVEKSHSESSDKFKLTQKYGKCDPGNEYKVNNEDLALLMSIHDCQYNIIALSKYVLQMIDEGIEQISHPRLIKNSPFKEEAEKMEKEKISIDEAIDFVKSY